MLTSSINVIKKFCADTCVDAKICTMLVPYGRIVSGTTERAHRRLGGAGN